MNEASDDDRAIHEIIGEWCGEGTIGVMRQKIVEYVATRVKEARQEAFKEGIELIRKLPDHSALCGIWLQQVCDCSFRIDAMTALERAAATDNKEKSDV